LQIRWTRVLSLGAPPIYVLCISMGLITVPALASAQTPTAATELRRIPAPEANQGVASDAHFVYAIDDGKIGKYDKSTGKRVALFEGDPKVFIHMNSCNVVAAELVCSMSNFPNLPQVSSVEWFSTATLKHLRSHSFGPTRGSMTWIDFHDNSWWACFANYDGHGGDPTRDHNATTLVRYSTQFVEQGAWLFPENVLKSFGHMSASGGRWGRDGYLYVTGHDLPEMYVLKLPAAGARLEYIRTIGLPTDGQAFDWDMSQPTHVWTIERKRTEMVESRLP
jgi:hypothetical protein